MSIFEYDYNGHMQVIREEGKEDGYSDGKKEGIELMVINMIKKDFDIDLISELSGLTKEEIEKLREECLQEA